MHPENIKAAIRIRGKTAASIADELGVSRAMVSLVINGAAKSSRVAEHISALLGESVESLWPEKSANLRRKKAETSHKEVVA